VVACLAEKQATTPQYYPLTLAALVAACNQTSNRDPVVHYDDATVEDALAGLREKALARVVHSRHNRAARHRHVLDEALALDGQELAVLAVLMLRGVQTPGELRARTERMAELPDLADVQAVLDRLAARGEPLVARLERRSGQKEARYTHLLVLAEDEAETPVASSRPAPARPPDQLGALRDEVDRLRHELGELRAELADLRDLRS